MRMRSIITALLMSMLALSMTGCFETFGNGEIDVPSAEQLKEGYEKLAQLANASGYNIPSFSEATAAAKLQTEADLLNAAAQQREEYNLEQAKAEQAIRRYQAALERKQVPYIPQSSGGPEDAQVITIKPNATIEEIEAALKAANQ